MSSGSASLSSSCGFRRPGFQQIGLFNQRTDPIGTATFMGTGVAHAVDNIAAPGVGDGDGGHRSSARRQLVDNRGVQIGVGGHRRGAGIGVAVMIS